MTATRCLGQRSGNCLTICRAFTQKPPSVSNVWPSLTYSSSHTLPAATPTHITSKPAPHPHPTSNSWTLFPEGGVFCYRKVPFWKYWVSDAFGSHFTVSPAFSTEPLLRPSKLFQSLTDPRAIKKGDDQFQTLLYFSQKRVQQWNRSFFLLWVISRHQWCHKDRK